MAKLINHIKIYVKFNGLGDNLFFSHIPRLAKEAGAGRVSVFVNREILNSEKTELIWGINPYVDDINLNSVGENSDTTLQPGMDFLDSIAYDFGLIARRSCCEPEIYYKPQVSYAHLSVLDPNFVSGVGIIDRAILERHARRTSSELVMLEPLSRRNGLRNISLPHLAMRNLRQYFDLVGTADKFLCLASGGATLRAAFNLHGIVYYGLGLKPVFRHSLRNTYVDASPAWARAVPWFFRNFYRVSRFYRFNRT